MWLYALFGLFVLLPFVALLDVRWRDFGLDYNMSVSLMSFAVLVGLLLAVLAFASIFFNTQLQNCEEKNRPS